MLKQKKDACYSSVLGKPHHLIYVLLNHPTMLSHLQSLTQQQPKDFRRRLKLKINTTWHQQAKISTST